ncbi:hypothetical protein D9V32_02675 [Mycetocola tolaasinivorans]|uniref:Excalibur calcium-binding domain-containing protein n=1 Tax=Mycetocola tolaasinivorans TaxID=76635 RepID=A0A3L7ADB5_9MICO|nr:excalibur calcium-binding domain-containing protein [Mycetocola tolaasinivorans]RLP77372.1 hypothetical protein D9V32_02675 [Mycetocola tolaasinivorans]
MSSTRSSRRVSPLRALIVAALFAPAAIGGSALLSAAPAQAATPASVSHVVAAKKPAPKPAVKKPAAKKPAAKAKTYANCAALNKVYPHGVGRSGAVDRVSGKSKPVTNFTRNTAVYNANTKLDRDKDGVACEKR